MQRTSLDGKSSFALVTDGGSERSGKEKKKKKVLPTGSHVGQSEL